ncbi:tripartite motif-containing protein 2-like [Crassostrea angulata]|uniref:tripartite motif-containing protein 2-like n=1 Tax=Magallana angulata TaxID=2784310 RepID=UPI0022B1C0F5|nr:tripartite motif-containing protein 2-like [Crassostrea angulata]
METASIPCKVHQCSKCLGDTEYYCVSCPCDLCPQCKENHVKDLQTIDHDVVSHLDKINYIPTQEICVRHPSHVYRKYCEPCQVPVCYHCTQLGNHRQLVITTSYDTKREQHRGTIHTIRSEALFYRPVLLPRIKTDFKTCHTEFSLYQSEMLTKAQALMHLIYYIQNDFMCNVFCDFDFKHRCLKQKKEMIVHIVSLQRYVHIYEQRKVIRPLQFLSSIKTALAQIHLTLHTSQLSMTESLNKEDVMESLSAIQITERGNRRVGNQGLLKLTSVPEFHQSLTVTGVGHCLDFSCVTPDRVWVSDRNNLILTDTTGVPLHRVEDSWSDLYGGLHTVNSESELIYIDRNYNINKLSKDMKTTTRFIERTDSTWWQRCVYWSPSTGDLLVGMWYIHTETGKVTRYNQSGQLTQTIQHDNTGRGLYSIPYYITENNNGDVVVSDYGYGSGAVVVTERGGRHRFSYTGRPSGLGLRPRGICTDALSHILVCDYTTKTVQMLDKDGQFLSHLLTKSQEMGEPWSLSYDVNTHRLWVGSGSNNKVCVYRYITRQDALTDQTRVMESLSGIPTPGTEKPQQENQCLLKLMSPPDILQSLTVTSVGCNHISCVTSDRVWVSDRNNLILTDTTGVPLHRVEDSCSDLYDGNNGLHTVNSESELIYIDRNHNINKLSKDIKTTTTFIERTDSTWRPRCVYWSPSTGDLLVGVCYINNYIKIGKVTRYNQSGQLTQTIQNDNTGRGLYSGPHYITENNNGDVVVSDCGYGSGAVVVTERGGRHCFSYTGRPSGSGLRPRGICTDALSHILVCDGRTKTVQMLDKDGLFLSHLLTKSQEMGEPRSLSYDVNTHCLWVGSRHNNKVCICRYITRQDALTDEHRPRPDEEAMFSSTSAVEWR